MHFRGSVNKVVSSEIRNGALGASVDKVVLESIVSNEEAVTAINSTLNCNSNLSVRPTISAADTKKSKVKVQRTPDYRGKSKYTCCVDLVNCRAATVFQVRGT